MPIKGMTDRERITRVGKIRLGEKRISRNGNEYPAATDYFVCPPEVQDVFGEKPTVLDIVFPSDVDDMIAGAWYKSYSASRGLVCKGDGESADRLIDADKRGVEPDTGVVTGPIATRDAKNVEWARGITCPGEECHYYQQRNGCKRLMSLQFLLPKVKGLGVWQLDTSSFHGIMNVMAALRLIRELHPRKSVAGVPLKLVLEAREVSPDGQKKTVHVLNILKNDISLEQVLRANDNFFAVLPPPPDESQDDLLYPNGGFEDGSAGVIDPVAPGETVEQQAPPAANSRITDMMNLASVAIKEDRFMDAVAILDHLDEVPLEEFTADEIERFGKATAILDEWRNQQANTVSHDPDSTSEFDAPPPPVSEFVCDEHEYVGDVECPECAAGEPEEEEDEGPVQSYCTKHAMFHGPEKGCPTCVDEANVESIQSWNEMVNADGVNDPAPAQEETAPPVAGPPFSIEPLDWEDTLAFAPKYVERVRRVREAGDVVEKDSYTMMLGMCKLKDVQREAEKTIFGSAVVTWLKNNEAKDYGDACIMVAEWVMNYGTEGSDGN